MPFTPSRARIDAWGATFGRLDLEVRPGPAHRGWQLEAACRQLPTEMFFPIGHGPRAEAQTRLAKEVCNACAVRAQCLAYSLAANARYGVFGGMGEDERREVRRRNGSAFGLDDGDLEESA